MLSKPQSELKTLLLELKQIEQTRFDSVGVVYYGVDAAYKDGVINTLMEIAERCKLGELYD